MEYQQQDHALAPSSSLAPRVRPSVPIERLHQRFLLRELHFTQQFAALYYARLQAVQGRAVAALHASLAADGVPLPPAGNTRVLELSLGTPAIASGTLFKQMKAYTRFLDDYQKELIRIDAGDDDGNNDEALAVDVDTAANQRRTDEDGAAATTTSLCGDKDVLLLEDQSGRIELCGNIRVDAFVTGVVVAIHGTLMGKGRFDVERVTMCGAAVPAGPPRWPLTTSPQPAATTAVGAPAAAVPAGPRYVAFVCGMRVGFEGHAAANLDLLVDYFLGALGDEAAVAQAAAITRLIVGGDSVDATEELKLKAKVKLDPTDHVRVNDTKEKNTSANCMRSLDALLALLADSVEVDLMPGELDPSNAFLPQQPIHPILLKTAAKKSTLRLVTNPYEFRVPAFAATFHVSSGQNVTDVEKQTRFSNCMDRMELIHRCGCACPTAPNSLVCYPFKDTDPFIFSNPLNVFVACNQPTFETAWRNGCRYISIPPYAAAAMLVLVDLNSPDLAVTPVCFA